MTGWARVFIIAVLALGVGGAGNAANAQGSDPFAASQKLSDGGKHREAAAAISRVLNSGTLSPANTARGFYLRGVSLQKSGKNPQAISDLTNALWLSGLSDRDRSNAYLVRAAAYKASGFKAKAAADLKKSRSKPKATQSASVIPIPVRRPSAGTSNEGSNWSTQTGSSVASNATTATPAASKPAATPSTGNAVSDFFGGLFGGGSTTAVSTTSNASLSRDEAGTAAPSSKPKVRKKTSTASAASGQEAQNGLSSWSSSVAKTTQPKVVVKRAVKPKQVASVNWNTAVDATPTPRTPKRKPVLKTKSVAKAATKAHKSKPNSRKKAAVRKGRYNVQVATVRDRGSAETIIAAVQQQAPKALGGLKPSIDTAVLGNMGTFFRVRVDGLPSRQASTKLCAILSKQGHDCFLLTR